jgi:hypothetical protein
MQTTWDADNVGMRPRDVTGHGCRSRNPLKHDVRPKITKLSSTTVFTAASRACWAPSKKLACSKCTVKSIRIRGRRTHRLRQRRPEQKSVVTDDHRIYYCVGRTGTFPCKYVLFCARKVFAHESQFLLILWLRIQRRNLYKTWVLQNGQQTSRPRTISFSSYSSSSDSYNSATFSKQKKPRNRPNYARGRRKIREIPITIASTIMRSTSHRPPFSSLSLSIGVG